jgi:ribosomal protein S1
VADLKVGDLVDGTVTKIVNFGSFVRVRDGLEGLIHISELSHQRVAHPGDVVHEGQTLKLKVISLDSERHRLGLSLKQAEEAPARPARERRPRGERTGYDRSQAIQEPEGGIDNTLAAAFAQVRQQIAEQDAAQAGDAAPEAQAGEVEAVTAVVEPEPADQGDAVAHEAEEVAQEVVEPVEDVEAVVEPAAEPAVEATEPVEDAAEVAAPAEDAEAIDVEADAPEVQAEAPEEAREAPAAAIEGDAPDVVTETAEAGPEVESSDETTRE